MQANSVPASFWTLALLALPSSRGLVADIRAEAAQTGGAASPQQQAVQVWINCFLQESDPVNHW
jgi:hypothetical protein